MKKSDNKCWRGCRKTNKEKHSELRRFRVKLNLQRSQEVPRGGKMAAQAGNVFYTKFTFPWEPEFGQSLRQLINNSSDYNQHKATLGLIPVWPQFACFIKANPVLHLSRSDPLNWFLVQNRLALAFLAVSAWTICHLTNLIPSRLVSDGSAIFKDSVHKIMNKGLT